VDHHAVGFAAYLRIQPRDGVIEIGSIVFSPRLQRTTAATEAIYLMLRNVFALGYRRCEWKCDDLNAPSRAAADRLGFTYEGTFRQATHYKGRNRDTAWYAIVNREWPALDGVFQRWLAPDNFDDDGVQRQSLGKMRETML
jgi:RimJ/RimL family protein N-acetyltransferase